MISSSKGLTLRPCRRPRTKGKRRKIDESEDEESSLTESDEEEEEAQSDAGRSSVHEPPKTSDDEAEEDQPEGTGERLKRSARTKAQVSAIKLSPAILNI